MKQSKHYDFFNLFDKFLKDSSSGKRLQKNGKRLRKETVSNYKYLRKLLYEFSIKHNFELRLVVSNWLNKREFKSERMYWKKFYRKFTDYLYLEKSCFDNYVGTNIKILRAFFNYLNTERGLNIGSFHKSFYVRKEMILIVVLTPEQLNFLIYDHDFEKQLSDRLKRTKDIFVFGCTVALRISDLMRLSRNNLEQQNGSWHLKVISRKTQTITRIKLPQYAVDLLTHYPKKQKTLLPTISVFNLNNNIRLLMEAAGWNYPVIKMREQRGVPQFMYRNSSKKEHFRFCDLVSSHTMRRTAITTMLSLGMPEHLVRKVSGHSANSKEFFRYVALSQSYIDKETEIVFEKLSEKSYVKSPNFKEKIASESA